MSEPVIVQPAPQPINQITNQLDNQAVNEIVKEKSKLTTYILYGVCIIGLIVILYIAYSRFISNSECDDDEPKKIKKEKDEPVSDYNLYEAIDELKAIQQNVLRNISDDVNI